MEAFDKRTIESADVPIIVRRFYAIEVERRGVRRILFIKTGDEQFGAQDLPGMESLALTTEQEEILRMMEVEL